MGQRAARSFKECVFTPDGRFLVTGSTRKFDPAIPTFHIGRGKAKYSTGQILEIHPATNQIIGVYTTDHAYSKIRVDALGQVYLFARNNIIHCLSTDLKTTIWSYGATATDFAVTPEW